MPHDRNGTLVQVGDEVTVRMRVKEVTAGEKFCNLKVDLEIPPGVEGYCTNTMWLNTRQVEKVEKPEDDGH